MKSLLVSDVSIDQANTNRSPTDFDNMKRLGSVDAGDWCYSMEWQSLGQNAACVGRLFLALDNSKKLVLIKDVTLTEVIAGSVNDTNELLPVEKTIKRFMRKGVLYAAVTVDLTGSPNTGYLCYVNIGNGRADFEQV